MNKLQIIVDGEFYTSSQSKNLIVVLYIDHCGISFPDDQWTDFIDVLNMWTFALVDNIKNENVTFSLPFMDGSFRLDVVKKEDMKITVRCISDSREEIIKYTFECEYIELLWAVYRAIKTVLKKMYDSDMHKGKYGSVYKDYVFVIKKLKTAIDELLREK
jgi:hypothetical protein